MTSNQPMGLGEFIGGPEKVLEETVKKFFFNLPESVEAKTKLPKNIIDLENTQLRGEMYSLFYNLASKPDVQETYSKMDPVTFPFHNFWHACRVFMYCFYMGKTSGLSDGVMNQLGLDALRHDLGLSRTARVIAGHEDVFGADSFVPATILELRTTESGEQVLSQLTRNDEAYGDGEKIARIISGNSAKGYDRIEVEKAMDILGDADLLGLGNGKGMAASILESYNLIPTGESLTPKVDRNAANGVQKAQVKKVIESAIMIYKGPLEYGFNTDQANAIMTRSDIEAFISRLQRNIENIDVWFPEFEKVRDRFFKLKPDADYGEVFGIIDELDKVMNG